ncbi:MFS transporter [Microtetraspora sp. NBRC 13810]|uniref:MFS transporter n=1 Tax=Microtetraspora sp. NBRC 13810 TaxID=3030990 RepID=UPI002555E719|nr:MFS transporter [Microtetraspora sp. NBRC 13810]
MRARLPLRLARSAAFSVVCVALAALGHGLAGGTGPAAWAVAAGGTVVMLLATATAGRERSAAVISVGLIATQLFLHELFALDGSTASLSTHLHGGGSGLGESVGMLAAHLTATLITGWWLARGEAALWSLLRRLGSAVTRRLGALLRRTGSAPRPLPPVPAAGRRPAASPAAVLRHTVIRRGPPLPAA